MILELTRILQSLAWVHLEIAGIAFILILIICEVSSIRRAIEEIKAKHE